MSLVNIKQVLKVIIYLYSNNEFFEGKEMDMISSKLNFNCLNFSNVFV